MNTEFKTLAYAGIWVDTNKLAEGIYEGILPHLFHPNHTKESIFESYKRLEPYLNLNEASLLEIKANIEKCRLVSIKLVADESPSTDQPIVETLPDSNWMMYYEEEIEKELTKRWNSTLYNPEGTTVRESLRRGVIVDFKKSKTAEVEVLRKALEWYADCGNYCYDMDNSKIATAWQYGKVENKAREALASTPQPSSVSIAPGTNQ